MKKHAGYVQEIKDNSYAIIKAAKNTQWHKQHKKTQAKINTIKR
jgi:hypothetical protein